MCGISCAVTVEGSSPLCDCESSHDGLEARRSCLREKMDKSLDQIIHRGPDARGQWISDDCQIAMGHNRLSIIDLSPEAEQPFHDEENQIHAVVNGEFYDYEAIRENLIRQGHHFKSRCDSEIVIALYKEHGMSFLSHLRGEFAFCLYDAKAQFFIAVVDRYGVKPLFYTFHNSQLLIASEMKAFLSFGWQPEWDVQSLRHTGFYCDQRTVFQDVHQIRPGHYLTLTSMSVVEQRKWWDMDFKDKNEVERRTEEEMIKGVRERLVDAVKVRLRADVPVGVYLSGGLDSSATLGIIKHLLSAGDRSVDNEKFKNINCFCVKFADAEFDEEPVAERTAEWLGIQKHTIHVTEDIIAAHFEDACWHNEVPFIDLCFVAKFALSTLPQSLGIKVIISGEGSDEHFGGYGDLLTDYLRESDNAWWHDALPEHIRVAKFEELEYREGFNYSNLHTFRPEDPPTAKFARRQINNISYVGFLDLFSIGNQFATWTEEKHGVVDHRTTAVNNILDGITRNYVSLKWHPLHSALYIWTRCILSGGILTVLGDRAEMAHSIEGREPFLDHHLNEYVMNLPPTMKIRYDPETDSFNEKWILKEAAKPFVTEEIYKRRKHPFSAPVKYKIKGPVHQMLENLVNEENVHRLGFLDWGKCEDLIKEAVVKQDCKKMRDLLMIAQLIVLGKKFGVKRSESPKPKHGAMSDQKTINGGKGSLRKSSRKRCASFDLTSDQGNKIARPAARRKIQVA